MSELSLTHAEEIRNDAEELELEDEARREIITAVLRDWSGPTTFSLLEQPLEREVEVDAFLDVHNEEVTRIPRYRTYKITKQLLENRRVMQKALEELQDGLFSDVDLDDPCFEFVQMGIEEINEKTRYLELSVEHQKAVDEGNMALAERTGEELMELGKLLYGEVEPEIFDNMVAYTRMNISQEDVSDIAFGEEIRDEFLSLLPETGTYEPLQLSGEFYEAMEIVVMENIEEYLVIIDENPPKNGETYSPRERVDLYNLVLDKISQKGYNHDFKAVLDEDAKTESIRQKEQQIAVAGKRSSGEPNIQEFKALMSHEILRHVLVRIIAENSGEPILGLGFPNYDVTEEAEGKLLEQVVNGEYYESGVDYILADGFSRGIRTDKMNKDDVFEIIWRKIYLFSEPHSSQKQASARGNVRLAKELAENVTRRMYRIGTGEVPGVHYPKDVAYNNRRSWQLYQRVFEERGIDGLREIYNRHRSVKYNYFDPKQDDVVTRIQEHN